MDEILQRVLAVEKEAAELVAEAETAAEGRARDARRDVAAYLETAAAELAAECEGVIQERVSDAETAKAAALQAAATDLQQRLSQLRSQSQNGIELVLAELTRTAG